MCFYPLYTKISEFRSDVCQSSQSSFESRKVLNEEWLAWLTWRKKTDLRKAAIRIHLRFDPLFFICGQNYIDVISCYIDVITSTALFSSKNKFVTLLNWSRFSVWRIYVFCFWHSLECNNYQVFLFLPLPFVLHCLVSVLVSVFCVVGLGLCLWLVFCSCLLFLSFVFALSLVNPSKNDEW